tara:strand:+ start:21702 stop:22466 length:765 start_codon:yes stop_codon:yes gene_type:complete
MAVITVLLLGSLTTEAQIIGFKQAQQATQLTPAQAQSIANQTWLFTHASVGGNMLKGMNALAREDADRYVFKIKSFNAQNQTGLDQLQSGCVYHASRGNPGWQKKYDIFDSLIRTANPSATKLVAMDKLCYIDQSADAETYLNMMAKLEKDFPAITFVYTTIPIKSNKNRQNLQRQQYNDTIRNYIRKKGGLLYDIADIEAHSPQGEAQTFKIDGKQCEAMCDSYTRDGGHLNDEGARQVALGWYAVALAIAGK